MTLTGDDAESFEIVGLELFLKAGVALDFETKTSDSVSVVADDTTVGLTPDATSSAFTLTVTDVENEAPTAVAIDSTIASIAEGASTAARIKVGDITVTDDALGTNTLTLTGDDAGLFEIDGMELFLRAGVTLDFETKSSYSVAVTADDETVGATPDATSMTYTLTVTNVSPEIINGTSAANTLTGGRDIDKIFGFAGNDTLSGLVGNDILTGGLGRDTMTGGAGYDDFDFNAVSETGKSASTRDIVKDFQHLIDDIDLSTINANSKVAGNQAFSFLAAKGAAFTGVAGQLHWLQLNPAGTAADKTIIEGDVNGDRIADFQIELTGLRTLTAADFFL